MNKRRVFIFIMIVSFGMTLMGVNAQILSNITGNGLAVSFVDVGQADCILIHTPANQNILIDSGNREDFPTILNYLNLQRVSRLDMIVTTHPHEDHIGSMAQIVRKFNIGKVYMPRVSANTRVFEDLLTAIQAKGLKIMTAKAGVHLDLTPEIKMDFLAPNSDSYEDLNNYSAVIKLTYRKVAFLLTGDAERISEQEMMDKQYNLKANVLKVGHHGSNSSSSNGFLQQVAPDIAIISVGLHNDYHHPSLSTLKRLAKIGARVYRTDHNGTIQITTDGYQLFVRCSENE
jgi:beta-lactamase superfamily II metal-dependent hydrolase